MTDIKTYEGAHIHAAAEKAMARRVAQAARKLAKVRRLAAFTTK
jgi:hypothetical protein